MGVAEVWTGDRFLVAAGERPENAERALVRRDGMAVVAGLPVDVARLSSAAHARKRPRERRHGSGTTCLSRRQAERDLGTPRQVEVVPEVLDEEEPVENLGLVSLRLLLSSQSVALAAVPGPHNSSHGYTVTSKRESNRSSPSSWGTARTSTQVQSSGLLLPGRLAGNCSPTAGAPAA